MYICMYSFVYIIHINVGLNIYVCKHNYMYNVYVYICADICIYYI